MPDSLFEQIHQIRQKLAFKCQERHKSDLQTLGKALEKAGLLYPYGSKSKDGSKDSDSVLLAEDAFSNKKKRQPKGPTVTMEQFLSAEGLENPTFLFRIHRIDRIRWTKRDVRRMKASSKKLLKFKEASQAAPATEGWLALKDYTEVSLRNHRYFSWWTDTEPPLARLVEWVYTLGQEALRRSMIILRCRLASVCEQGLLRIPSALDGFDSPIFQPVPYHETATSGTAISLKSYPEHERLGTGGNEYVLCPINPAEVNFYPLDDFLDQHDVSLLDDDNLLHSLLSYYHGLLEQHSER